MMHHGSPWQHAASFAARAHRHQLRKDGHTPYIAHVYRVALTLCHVFAFDDEPSLVAAILHDTIEDTTTDYDAIQRRFGTPVADMVAALTKNMALPEGPREEEYDQRLARADWRVRLIKLADVYDNASDWSPDTKLSASHVAKAVRRAVALAQRDLAHPEGGPVVTRAIAAVERALSDLESRADHRAS